MDANCAHRGPAEHTRRGNAATWFHTWELPTILVVGGPGDWEGVGREESGSHRGSQNSPSRDGILSSGLLEAIGVRGSVPASPSRHQTEEMVVNRCLVFASSNLSLLATVFLFPLSSARRPTKRVFYSLNIERFLVFRSEVCNNSFPS